MALAYEVKGLSKTYKKGKVAANRNITMDIKQGEIIGILGPNGAGKSTLVKQLVGHCTPSSGEIRLFGTDVIRNPTLIPMQVSYFAQQPGALLSLTTEEAVYYTGRLRKLSRKEAQNQTEELLHLLQLDSLRKKRIRKMSGGEKRLASLAVALIGKLPILVLDEPTNELDPQNRKLIWSALKERNRTQGTTIMLVTHNVLEAEQVVDRVGIIADGELLALDTVGALKNQMDRRLNLDVTARFGEADKTKSFLVKIGEIIPVSEHRFRIRLNPEQIGQVLDFVTQHQEEMSCEQFQLVPLSLEDVYFSLGGKGGFENE